MTLEFRISNLDRRLDVKILDCLQRARALFFELLCQRSADQNADLMTALNTDATYIIAEFYYRLKAQGIDEPHDLERLANDHNLRLGRVSSAERKAGRPIPKPERIQHAIFSKDVMMRLLQNWREYKGAIDQSNLARLLVMEMSTETCRKAVVALAKAGCLDRVHTPYGTTLVISKGWLEDVFETALKSLYVCIEQAHSSATAAGQLGSAAT
ncbi:hypothetical protein [Xanthobacter oligotrophicus]|uniref:hypothetical protein n=1 Tax=Xanthobacter oligotrophicus TaxID=2607286 RepID=UPI0011F348E2|nr:hypothetical protein [Xanthobacter oligotrophicus]MCG5233978.1 hypothetical protein [Xanthobacter oligotrophicus]